MSGQKDETRSVAAGEFLRLFVAVWLPPGPAEAAWRRLERLRPGSRGVRWVRREQLHLTLKFLGDTPAGALPALTEALATAASASGPLTVALGAGGIFPPAGPPRVLWLGIEPEKELCALAGLVEKALQPLGYTPDARPFRPHLTLGRAEPGAVFDRDLLAKSLAAPPAEIGSIALVRSELKPSGPVYTDVGEWRLGGGVNG